MANEVVLENGEAPDLTDAPGVETSERKIRKPGRPKKAVNAVATAEEPGLDQPVKKTRAKGDAKATAPASRRRIPHTSEHAQTGEVAGDEQTPASSDGDGLAELLALEEENRSLRKQLSEKLRAENAELRRRLARN